MTVFESGLSQNSADQKVSVHVECCLRGESSASPEETRHSLLQYLSSLSKVTYVEGPLTIDPLDSPFLAEHAASVSLVDLADRPELVGRPLLSWDIQWEDFHGLWETLYYESTIKQRLLRYATSALLFSERGVDASLISWNRVVLLHGPPGTGKTSLCKALAQKLAIRLMPRYHQGVLIEVNAHSLFSKWFSESGKLIGRLFSKIQEVVEDETSLVFVLIDEVESLTAARKSALGGSEPTDAIRAVNALLTRLDALKAHPNVMVLTTSNITEAIDVAFVDRADIKAYIGPPNLEARYAILASCLAELERAGILRELGDIPPFLAAQQGGSTMDEGRGAAPPDRIARALLAVAQQAEGLSGRSLRKLPFLAHASQAWATSQPCPALPFLRALREALACEGADRAALAG